jgi:hypothetical protein
MFGKQVPPFWRNLLHLQGRIFYNDIMQQFFERVQFIADDNGIQPEIF